MTNFFQDTQTVEEIKKQYRTLALKWHPDRGGCEETMKAINAQYHDALKMANGQKSTSEYNGATREHTYTYDADIETALMNKILEILAANIEGLEVALVGTWIWVSGSKKEQAPLLGKTGLGLSWHSKRKMWFFNCESGRRYYSKKSFDDLADKYGYKKFSKGSNARNALNN